MTEEVSKEEASKKKRQRKGKCRKAYRVQTESAGYTEGYEYTSAYHLCFSG